MISAAGELWRVTKRRSGAAAPPPSARKTWPSAYVTSPEWGVINTRTSRCNATPAVWRDAPSLPPPHRPNLYLSSLHTADFMNEILHAWDPDELPPRPLPPPPRHATPTHHPRTPPRRNKAPRHHVEWAYLLSSSHLQYKIDLRVTK